MLSHYYSINIMLLYIIKNRSFKIRLKTFIPSIRHINSPKLYHYNAHTLYNTNKKNLHAFPHLSLPISRSQIFFKKSALKKYKQYLYHRHGISTHQNYLITTFHLYIIPNKILSIIFLLLPRF